MHNHLVTDFSYADVVERLFREFNGQRPLAVIVDVVHACLTDLEGQVPPGALAELLERSPGNASPSASGVSPK